MKVYAVSKGFIEEGGWIVGVFGSKKKAEKFVRDEIKETEKITKSAPPPAHQIYVGEYPYWKCGINTIEVGEFEVE